MENINLWKKNYCELIKNQMNEGEKINFNKLVSNERNTLYAICECIHSTRPTPHLTCKLKFYKNHIKRKRHINFIQNHPEFALYCIQEICYVSC
jgi:hypothetical protein